MAHVDSGPVLPKTFPPFSPVRVRMPIVGNEMTIWPGPKETFWDWVEGFPYELHPFAWDYMWISCDAYSVKIQPHYLDSTWDTFWTDGVGTVTAQALGGLFPFTLGKQYQLLQGIVATLAVLPNQVRDTDPDAAKAIEEIHAKLEALEVPPAAEESDVSGLRRTLSESLWRRKLRQLPQAARVAR